MAPQLHIIDNDGFSKGRIEARIGLITTRGRIVRVTEKSIWTSTPTTGGPRLHRAYDGRLPSIPFYKLPRADRAKLGC